MANVPVSTLQDGDVLLYHGTAFISRMILLLDGGDYSHAAVFRANHITEALGGGITINQVAASVASCKFVDVYRFVKDGEKLGSATYPIPPLNTAIENYETHPQRYAYEQILLLALLCSTRKLNAVTHMPGFAMIVRNILDTASDEVAKIIGAGKEPVICSELVYRCYSDADTNGKYKLPICGADITQMMAFMQPAVPAEPEVADIQARAADFLLNYYAAKHPKQGSAPPAAAALPTAEVQMMAAVANFVTPRDLQFSPNLQLKGTLQF
jgi:hypothetical protein